MTTSANKPVVLNAQQVKAAKAAIAGMYKICDHSRKTGEYTITHPYENKNRIGVQSYLKDITKALEAGGFIVNIVEAMDSWTNKIKGGVASVESYHKIVLTLNVPTPVAPAAPVADAGTTDNTTVASDTTAPTDAATTVDAQVDTGDAQVSVQVDATVDADTAQADTTAPVADAQVAE